MIPEHTWKETPEELNDILTKIEERCKEIEVELKQIPSCWEGESHSRCKERKELQNEMYKIVNKAIIIQGRLQPNS